MINILRPPLTPTFQLPSRKELLSLKIGDSIKLIFGGRQVERMWVTITDVSNSDKWIGVLDNEPLALSHKLGQRVRFHPLDIIDITKAKKTKKRGGHQV